MNISTNYSNTNQSYKHLSEADRGEIEAYLSVELKPAEIARRLGRNRSTITREINPGSVKQVKQVNGSYSVSSCGEGTAKPFSHLQNEGLQKYT